MHLLKWRFFIWPWLRKAWKNVNKHVFHFKYQKEFIELLPWDLEYLAQLLRVKCFWRWRWNCWDPKQVFPASYCQSQYKELHWPMLCSGVWVMQKNLHFCSLLESVVCLGECKGGPACFEQFLPSWQHLQSPQPSARSLGRCWQVRRCQVWFLTKHLMQPHTQQCRSVLWAWLRAGKVYFAQWGTVKG